MYFYNLNKTNFVLMTNRKNMSESQADGVLKYYIIVIITAFVLYVQSINNEFNIDDDYVYENHRLVQQGISGIPEIFQSRYHDRDEYYFGYRPLTVAIYAIEYEFFGMNPHTAHLFNVIYYIICCSLLFYVLLYLLKPKLENNAAWYAFLVSIIFTTHAIHSEVVLSIKNREEILSLVLSLFSVLFALRFFDSRKLYNILISICFLTLAFLAKESAIVFLAIIPLTIVFFKSEVIFSAKIKTGFAEFLKNEKGLFISLIISSVLFILATPSMRLVDGITLYTHNFNFQVNQGIIYMAFLIHFFYVLSKSVKNEQIKALSIKNVIIWTIVVLFIFYSFTTKAYFLVFTSMFLLVFTLIPNQKGRKFKPLIVEKYERKTIFTASLFVFLGGLIIALAFFIPKQSLPEINAPVHNWQNPMFAAESSFADKVGLVFYSLIYYIKLLIIPFPLRYYYGYAMIPAVNISNPFAIFSMVAHLALLIYAFKEFNKRNIISYAIFFFLIAIVPYSNLFFPFTGVIAERVLFVPSIGFSIAVVCLIYYLLGKHKERIYSKSNRNKSLALALIIIIPNSLISINRNDDWKNRDTLFAKDIQVLENSAKANNVYASHIFGKVQHGIKQRIPVKNFENEVRLAVQHYKRAIEVDSTYSEAWHNLGYVYMILYGDYKLAEFHYSKCLENDSTIAAAYLNRGIANHHLGNYNQAITDFIDYLTKNENYKNKELDKAYVFSGKSHLALGDTLKAVEKYKMAVENLKESNLTPAVLKDVKDFFISVNKFEDAIEITHLEIELTPDNNQLYVDIGNYHLLSGDTIKAIQGWERAFDHYRGNFNIAMTLKGWFESQGDYEKAQYYHDAAWEFRMNNPNLK
jgi:tetratricopeptide (TPR) repeat protein